MQNALLCYFTFFFHFSYLSVNFFSLFWLYPSTMKAYHIDHLFFSFFFSNYILTSSTSFWLLLKLYVPEVEHDERHFFWRKKNKTPICCLNSLCRTLLQSTVLWISGTMKNYFLWFVLDWKMASFIHFSIPQANYNF